MHLPRTALFAALLVASTVPAQVPPDHLVLGTRPAGPGTSGLFLVSLETSGVTRVAGLPKTYEQTSATNTNGGVWSVVRRSDGRLVLGTGARSGVLSMDMVTLNTSSTGSTVAQTRTVALGTIQSGWFFGTPGAGLLPDGRRVLIGGPRAGGFSSGPMAGHQLGIVDFDATPPTVTPLRLRTPMLGNFVSSLTVSPDGRYAYVITYPGKPNVVPFMVYQVDLQKSPAEAILIYQEGARVLVTPSMVGSHTLYIADMDDLSAPPNKPTDILEFDIQGWGKVPLKKRHTLLSTDGLGGTLIDPASGSMLMAAPQRGQNPFCLFRGDHRAGTVKLWVCPPPGGWGAPQTADLHASMQRYGQTPQQPQVGFETHPNPGGIPAAGNLNFSLTLKTTLQPANPAALLLLGVKPLDVPICGTRLLVDPALVIGVPVPMPTTALQLPIPTNTPKGTTLLAQWALNAAGSCAASRGMKIVTR